MTDNEIIKALECCTNCSSPEVCLECPYLECTTKKGCYEEVITDALSLINRLKQENEELKRDAKYSEEFKKIVEKYTGGKP